MNPFTANATPVQRHLFFRMNERLGFSNRRGQAIWLAAVCLSLFTGLFAAGFLTGEEGLRTHFIQRNLPPSMANPFGTDWLGRDMLVRTIKGLCLSLKVGMMAALCTTVCAMVLGTSAAILGKRADALITGMVDVVMSTPHLVLLILIAFSMGGGTKGVVIAVALTHWTRLARIIRAEVLQLKNADYVKLSSKLGKKNIWIARHHLLPHLFPQFLVGLILLFPHAIMHAAGLTFLGFGLSPHKPSIGILLSEAMQHLSTGHWWLAVGPGAALIFMVKLFDVLGGTLRYLLDPKTSQE